MKYYHGTAYESAMEILKSKKFGSELKSKIWNCSCENTTYCISEEYEDSVDEAKRFAIEAGQIAAAHINSKSNDIIIFEFESDPENFIEDSSCENMYHSYEIENDDLNALIENNQIKMRCLIAHNAYEPYLRPFYLMNLTENQYYNFEDDKLKYICQQISKHDDCWFYEDFIGSYNQIEEFDTKQKGCDI